MHGMGVSEHIDDDFWHHNLLDWKCWEIKLVLQAIFTGALIWGLGL